VFVTCQVRVALEHGPGCFLGLTEQLAVAIEIGQPEGRQAVLAGPEKITRAAQFKVLAGDFKAIGRLAQGAQALPGQIIVAVADQDTVGFVGSAPDPATQLVQLGQTETLGIFDDHQGGIGIVHTNFDHGRADQDLDVTGCKISHDGIFGRWFEAAMQKADAQVRKNFLSQAIVRLDGRLEVERGLFFNHRTDDVSLPARLDLAAHQVLHPASVASSCRIGGNGFAPSGKLVDD